jgi:hypothetical protein
MKITIGSLIRKELSNPDSDMSRAVRTFKAYSRLVKNDPKRHKIALRSSLYSKHHFGFNYYWRDDYYSKQWQIETSSHSSIAKLLKLELE